VVVEGLLQGSQKARGDARMADLQDGLQMVAQGPERPALLSGEGHFLAADEEADFALRVHVRRVERDALLEVLEGQGVVAGELVQLSN
jgi:hypothetical protein